MVEMISAKFIIVFTLSVCCSCLVFASQGVNVERKSSGPIDCVIESPMTVKLSSPVSGIVESVSAQRGDLVKKGQVIATIERAVDIANLALARARATDKTQVQSSRARAQLLNQKRVRAKSLSEKALLAASKLEEAEAEAEVASHALKQAEMQEKLSALELKRAEAIVRQKVIRSPIDGVIVDIKTQPGEYSFENNYITKIMQIDPLQIELYVPLNIMSKLQIGVEIKVVPEEPYSKPLLAKITSIDRVVDVASGTIGVRMTIPNASKSLPPGIRCRAYVS